MGSLFFGNRPPIQMENRDKIPSPANIFRLVAPGPEGVALIPEGVVFSPAVVVISAETGNISFMKIG